MLWLQDAYYSVLPFYFPRTKEEEALAANLLPADIGIVPITITYMGVCIFGRTHSMHHVHLDAPSR